MDVFLMAIAPPIEAAAEQPPAAAPGEPAGRRRGSRFVEGPLLPMVVLFAVGYRVAQADKFPEWKPGNEFRAKRDAMLKK